AVAKLALQYQGLERLRRGGQVADGFGDEHGRNVVGLQPRQHARHVPRVASDGLDLVAVAQLADATLDGVLVDDVALGQAEIALRGPRVEDAMALHAIGQHVARQPEVTEHVVAPAASGKIAASALKSFVLERSMPMPGRTAGPPTRLWSVSRDSGRLIFV